MAFFLSPWLYIVEGYVGRWYNGSIKSGLIGEKTNEKYIDYFKLAKKKRKFTKLKDHLVI